MKLQSSLNAHHNLEELILNVNLTVTGYLTLNINILTTYIIVQEYRHKQEILTL